MDQKLEFLQLVNRYKNINSAKKMASYTMSQDFIKQCEKEVKRQINSLKYYYLYLGPYNNLIKTKYPIDESELIAVEYEDDLSYAFGDITSTTQEVYLEGKAIDVYEYIVYDYLYNK